MNSKKIIIQSYDGIFKEKINSIKPRNVKELIKIINKAKKKKIKLCFRGSGKAYGDQNFIGSDDLNLNINSLNKILNFDESKLEVEVETGISISKLLTFLNRRGYTIKCLPGIKDITIGGAIANNVHGKDSYRSGFFSDHVKEIKYYNIYKKKFIKLKCSDNDFKLFFGSIGQFGFIYSIKIKLYTYYNAVKVKKIFFKNLIDLSKKLPLLKKYQFSYIYVNNFERENKLGCGYIELGENINKEIKKYIFLNKLKISLTKFILKTLKLIDRGRLTMRIINKFFLYFQMLKPKNYNLGFDEYNYPHQKIPNFYRHMYPKGFYEIQFFVKEKKLIPALKNILICLQKNCIESYFTGIKLHNKNTSVINYSKVPSYSVGFDIDSRKLNKNNLKKICSILKRYNCLLYFAKDSIFTFENFSKDKKKKFINFLKIKKRFDFKNIYSSNLMKRIKNEKN